MLNRLMVNVNADREYNLEFDQGTNEYRQRGNAGKPEEKSYSLVCPYCYTVIQSSYYLVSDGESYDAVTKDLGQYGQYRIRNS
jgi:hypothetical protein